jgi:cbb3-type cytochrome oxidase maturation protein
MIPEKSPDETRRPVERIPKGLLVVFLVVVVAAGCGFVFKMFEFSKSLHDTPDVSFALMPIATYLVVAGGFFFLLAWSFFSGHYQDIEGPKHFLLANERALDAATPPPRPRD